jgi:hypothetical protein
MIYWQFVMSEKGVLVTACEEWHSSDLSCEIGMVLLFFEIFFMINSYNQLRMKICINHRKDTCLICKWHYLLLCIKLRDTNYYVFHWKDSYTIYYHTLQCIHREIIDEYMKTDVWKRIGYILWTVFITVPNNQYIILRSTIYSRNEGSSNHFQHLGCWTVGFP